MCRVTMGHLRVPVGHLRVTISHLRSTISYLKATVVIGSYVFCTPVTHTQVLIEINFQAPKTLKTNY